MLDAKHPENPIRLAVLLATLVLVVQAAAGGAGVPVGPESTAREILGSTGVEGGLVVHLGCGDGALTAALRADDRFVVQGLDTNRAKAEAARRRLQSLGARLWAVAAADGTKLAERPLDSLPVFDGLIASAGRLYLVTTDGAVRCFKGRS